MILQELVKYYERQINSGDKDFAPIGLTWKEISFVVTITRDGDFVRLEDFRSADKKPRGRTCLVPQGETRTSAVTANLLWDNIGYVLGHEENSEKKKQDRTAKEHAAFKNSVASLAAQHNEDHSVAAVLKFLDSFSISDIKSDPLWEQLSSSEGNLSFRIEGSTELLCESATAHNFAMKAHSEESDASKITCLVTGKEDSAARLHPLIKGVYGSQSSGAALVSFNGAAFESFQKKQGANAPVGVYAATAYSTALNRLLDPKFGRKVQLADTSVVFWCEENHELEDLFFALFGEHAKNESSKYEEAVKALYAAPRTGVLPLDDSTSKFFVLGIGPNAARLSVRFWHKTTVGQLAKNMKHYFSDIEITGRPPWISEHPTLPSLLLSTALLRQRKNIDPLLPSQMLKAIIEGTIFPFSLASSIVRRIRSEQSEKNSSITYERAALLKAYLNRSVRRGKGGEKEMTIELDESNTNPGYNLGRLFAVLEKVQSEALGDVNTSIREKYYAGASSTPVTCFPILMRLKNHHLAKLSNKGRVVNLEKMIAQVMSAINEFPSHLSLSDQGRFAIGYYHQRQKFFTKTDTQKEGANGDAQK